MNGYDIITEVKKLFANESRFGTYYSRYTELDGEDCCLEDMIVSMFNLSETITQYSYETEHFDGGPGYEATVIFFA